MAFAFKKASFLFSHPPFEMSTPSAQETIEAFVRVLRQRLEQRESVDVPGLGTFSVEHRPSHRREMPDGEDEMVPPRDVVAFTPEQ
jgi:nucleoid DNA-binding protein